MVVNEAIRDKADSLEALESQLTAWENTKARTYQTDESFRCEGSFSRAVWSRAGITKLVWMTFGKSCPYCASLDGKVIGITENFLTAGETLEPEGADGPMIPSANIGHNPAHGGCDCGIGPG